MKNLFENPNVSVLKLNSLCNFSIMDYALREATRETRTGFTLTPRQSSRNVATYITDTDFADDLALISDYLEEAQLLLLSLEVAAKTAGLHVNYKKTEYMLYNQPVGDLVTLEGNKLKQVDNFNMILVRGYNPVKRT